MRKSFKSTIFFLLLTYSTLGVGQNYWDLRSAFNTGKPSITLRASGSTYAVLTNADVGMLVTTVDKFSLLSGIYPKILLKESNELNAFAGIKDGAPVMIFNKAMFDILVKDKDVAAAVIGHEMAHLYLNHGTQRATASDALNTIGLIAGIALEIMFQQKYGVQNVGFYTGTALATVATNSYTRNQEREADKQGIEWMVKAGYDPEGAIRLFQLFEGRFGNSFLTFLKTHPNPSERVENAKQIVASLKKPSTPEPNPLGLSPKLLALNKKIDEQNIQLIPKS
jgi:Zn-dependent protease with chaperone function